ncbi:MAG: TM0106 family RecB-like putative nuclease, partial [Candidatus Nanopelagicales bacterium]
MINDNGTMRYSATDITRWLSCAHASRLDALLQTDPELKAWKAANGPSREESAREPAAIRGDEHELAMLHGMIDSGLKVAEIPRPEFGDPNGLATAASATLTAMREGADVVFQAALVDGPWFGYADFLVRVDGIPSALGDYSYEVRDTKLARKPSASALIQMAHYGAMVEAIQQTPPPRLVIWLGTGELFEWPYRDAVPYLRQAQQAFLQFQHDLPETVPVPIASCAGCRWFDHCDEQWGPGDLRNVHRLSSRQRELLRGDGIDDIAALAASVDDARPDGIGVETFAWLREQAQVQIGDAAWSTISPQPGAAGIFGTPAAHPLDMYFDLEGDPFAATPTLDYLWAYCDVDGSYHYQWAHTPDEEREAFLWFLARLHEREQQGGDWKVYHYNTYEVTSMRRIAAAWPDEAKRDELVA